ncbi:hypothetical protein EIP86_009549 [Pleurotus ostreatoroseus]|nr:hypothetical protein EIP86_009549 [Pleurotus ostreatoroseus]
MFEFASGSNACETAQYAFTFHPGPSEGPQDESQASVPTSSLPEIAPASASSHAPIFALRNTPEARASSPAATDRFPAELLEVFFKYLDFGTISKEYLLVCSRVSRRWRAVALPHLFRTVLISFHGHPIQEASPREGLALPSRAPRGHIPRSKRDMVHTKNGTRRTSTLPGITRFFSANPQFAAHVRNLHLALALPSKKIVRTPWEYGSVMDRLSDEIEDEERKDLRVTDPSMLLAALRVFPRLDSLVLYDVTLRGPLDLRPHGLIDVPRLRLSFTGRKDEYVPLAEYVNVLGLFSTVDELWIGSFGDEESFDEQYDSDDSDAPEPAEPDSLAHTERFTVAPRVVHIDPLPPPAYAAVAAVLARSPALRYVETVPVRDPRQQRVTFRPRPRAASDTTDEQRLTVVVHLVPENSLFLDGWEEVAEQAWPFLVCAGERPATLVVARNKLPSTRVDLVREVGRDDLARVLAHLDALPGPLSIPLLLCHLQWDVRGPNAVCCLCCAELDATRVRANDRGAGLAKMLAQLVRPDAYPERCRNALDVVRGLEMEHAHDRRAGRWTCVCGLPLPNAWTLAKS